MNLWMQAIRDALAQCLAMNLKGLGDSRPQALARRTLERVIRAALSACCVRRLRGLNKDWCAQKWLWPGVQAVPTNTQGVKKELGANLGVLTRSERRDCPWRQA